MTELDQYCQLQEIITSGGDCPSAGSDENCEACVLQQDIGRYITCHPSLKEQKLHKAKLILAEIKPHIFNPQVSQCS
jgi:hypothetical protein